MNIIGRSERGLVIADTIFVMNAMNGTSTLCLRHDGKRKLHEGESGDNNKVKCDSCFDLHSRTYSVPCQHSYCKECLRGMFLSALNDRTLVPVKCCGERIDQRFRRDVLSLEECATFERILEEIETPKKMYCPNKSCGVFNNLSKVVADGDSSFSCKRCNQRLCARCHASHVNISCAQYQALPVEERNVEDLALFDTAKQLRYARCNRCNVFVEKIDGCSHVHCRCGNDFCYAQQRYQGPTPALPAVPLNPADHHNNHVKATASSAYELEEALCAHDWRGCNKVMDRPRLCHVCRQSKRCFQSYCTLCRLRVCAACMQIEVSLQADI